MNDQHLRDATSQLATAYPAICLVYLFGSRAKGDPIGPMSDYDFGVLVDRETDDLFTLQARLTYEFIQIVDNELVDVVLLNKAPIELAFAIIDQGVLLCERDLATRVEYEAYVMGRYGDYLPVLRQQRQEILYQEQHERRVQWYRDALRRTERTLGKIKAVAGKETD